MEKVSASSVPTAKGLHEVIRRIGLFYRVHDRAACVVPLDRHRRALTKRADADFAADATASRWRGDDRPRMTSAARRH